MVIIGRIGRREHQGIFQSHTAGDGQPDTVIHVAVGEDRIGLAVVGAERDPFRTVLAHQRDQSGEVPARRALPGEDPHTLAALLGRLSQRGALVVGLDPRGQVGVQLPAGQPGRVPVHPAIPGGGDLRQQLRVAGHHAWVVHHLGEPDRAELLDQRSDLGGMQLSPRTLERRCGHAARGADPERERQVRRSLRQRDDARYAEHVGDLVRVSRHRRGAMREHGPDELIDPELGGLQVHVRVDEAGRQRGTGQVGDLPRVPRAPAGDHAICHGKVGVNPLPGAGYEDPAAGEEEVSGFVATRDGKDAG